MRKAVFGKNIEKSVKSALDGCKLIVTDSNLKKLYPEYTENAFVIDAGEKSKTPETLFEILGEMQKCGLKRCDCVGAFGGGVVGDITGFAAALYMRGIEWVSVPTTLLAMVDSGMGGKTAVDFNGVKNLIGAFHMPSRTVISAHFLKTLPDREWLCGTGELVKTCLLNGDAYRLLKARFEAFCAHVDNAVCELISRCIEIKSAVVKADPKEKGLRKILNVGHTVGHALEAADDYRLSHGEYVLKGIMTETAMLKDFTDGAFYDELIEFIGKLTAPPRTSSNAVIERALGDKKNVGNAVSIMLVKSPGDVKEVRLDEQEFVKRYDAAVKELRA